MKRRPVRWTDEEFAAAISAAHARWKDDLEGNRGGMPFSIVYLKEHGLSRPSQRYRHEGRFEIALALCPEEVRRDWIPPRPGWDAARILQGFRDVHTRWKHDAQWGKPVSRPFCRNYLTRCGYGGLLQSLQHSGLASEIFIARIGGDVAADWRRVHHPWNPARMRDEFRAAHAVWVADAERGRPSGRSFNLNYLQRRGWYRVAIAAERHFRGGIHAFARTIPEIAAEWRFPPSHRISDIRRDVVAVYRAWRRDPRARAGRYPFGPAYFEAIGQQALIRRVYRVGYRRVVGGIGNAALRRDWGRWVRGMYAPAVRRLRRELFSAGEKVRAGGSA